MEVSRRYAEKGGKKEGRKDEMKMKMIRAGWRLVDGWNGLVRKVLFFLSLSSLNLV